MSNQTDNFDELKKIIMEADIICDDKAKSDFFTMNSETIQKALNAIKTAKPIQFGMILKILSDDNLTKSPISLFQFEPSEAICKAIKDNESEIGEETVKFYFERAEHLYRHAKTAKMVKYTDRHRMIESAITFVWERFDAEKKWNYKGISESEACNFIAKCYLLRSRLVLQKGSDIPEKKLEALTKASEWANKASEDMNEQKIEILIEKQRWDKTLDKEWIRPQLQKFLTRFKFDIHKPLHWIINDYAARFGLSPNNDSSVVKHIFPDKISGKKRIFPLYQARAAFRLKQDVAAKLKKAVEQLSYIPLSAPLWSDTVGLIETVKEADAGLWEDVAIDAWETCKKMEERLKLSIQVRWYWTKYRSLYDLAFAAAIRKEDLMLAISIADSLKSRPTIKAIAMENTLKGTDREKYVKDIETGVGYMLGLEEIRETTPEKIPIRDFYDVPDGWAAIHFYIPNQEEGYALIVHNKTCFHFQIPVKISEVWNAFENWNTYRKNFGVANSNSELQKLCRQIGDMLKPALEKIENTASFKISEQCIEKLKEGIPDAVVSKLKTLENQDYKNKDDFVKVLENTIGNEESVKYESLILKYANKTKGIIFIPYSFLHLVPLHAAKINDKYLFEEKQCVFLPSWSMAPITDTPYETKNTDILLTNWNYQDEIKQMIERTDWHNRERTENTSQDFFDALDHPPRLLVLFMHGQGDFVNPYNSKFIMNKGPLTHQDILGFSAKPDDPKTLNGSKVILTACETDLVSATPDLTDEHLSLASAFLRKGAREVIGALFECRTEFSKEIVLASKNAPNETLYQILQNIQKRLKDDNPNDVYFFSVFRVMGFPCMLSA